MTITERNQQLYELRKRLDQKKLEMSWGDGDSLDRERVRDYMNEIYGPVPVIATEAHFRA